VDDRTEIRRDDDGELCGFVERDGNDWLAVTVFGAWFARFDDGAQARDAMLESGLESSSPPTKRVTAKFYDPTDSKFGVTAARRSPDVQRLW
jgi:hypothetical protein